MSTAIDMEQADALLPRATANSAVPEVADEDDNDELKPWWAYVVELFVIPVYFVVSWLWPTWIWKRRGVRDQELFKLDTEIHWTKLIRYALDDLAYPIVHVPADFVGRERTIWRLRSWDWWTVKCWTVVYWIFPFFLYGPIQRPPFGIQTYTVQTN
ncbi:hypothetical protein E2P81_ATG01984 [Venturia nashicola]|nr:hypothetical protein E2P81_ATG01984 [Venturia nashicola]